MENAGGVFYAEWKDYRRRRWMFWSLLLGYLPGVFTIAMLLEKVLHSTADILLFFVAAIWVVTGIIAQRRLRYWPCPRCGQPFFASRSSVRIFSLWWFYRPFTNRCVHCRLPKWAYESR
jgi:hypothetical protein